MNDYKLSYAYVHPEKSGKILISFLLVWFAPSIIYFTFFLSMAVLELLLGRKVRLKVRQSCYNCIGFIFCDFSFDNLIYRRLFTGWIGYSYFSSMIGCIDFFSFINLLQIIEWIPKNQFESSLVMWYFVFLQMTQFG